MAADRFDPDPMSEPECTCWHIPDALGRLIPAAWWVLLPIVVVRLKDEDGTYSGWVTGKARDACWLDVGSGPERHLVVGLMGVNGGVVALRESQIAFAETAMPWLDPPRVQWEPVARMLGAELKAGSVWGGEPGSGPLALTAVLQGTGRDYVEICVRRIRHSCVPGDSDVTQVDKPAAPAGGTPYQRG